MEMDWKEILLVLIPTIPAIITAIGQISLKRQSKMQSAKQSILQMQMEDVMAVEILHKLPTNHARILYEYDLYKKNGGNSDVDEKMNEYQSWYAAVTNNFKSEGVVDGH